MVGAEVNLLVNFGDDRRVRATAYSLGGGLYLTASHVVTLNGDAVQTPTLFIRVTPGATRTECTVVWRSKDDDLDVAVIEAIDERTGIVDDLLWGRLSGTAEHRCDAVGFPRFAERDVKVAGQWVVRPELARVKGVVVLPSGSDTGTLAFDATNPPPWPIDRHGSAWTGMSGAPLYCQGVFVGITVGAPGALKDRRLYAVSAAAIANDHEFGRYLQARSGKKVELVELEAHERTVTGTAIEEVARTDPRNIQEVAAAQFGLSNAYYENVLSQAKRSFIAAVVAASVGLAFLLGAVIAALLGGSAADAAVVSTIGGAIVEAVAGLNFWLYSRTSAQLNAFHIRLERMQKYLLANSVSANISDDQRDAVMADLVRLIASEVPLESPEPPVR